MNVLRLKELRIDRLRLPGDFPQRVEAEKGKGRARSIGECGLVHPAMVRSESLEVIVGVDSIAALVAEGKEMVRCEIVECTDAEMRMLRIHEQLQATHLKPQQILDLHGEYLLLAEEQEKRFVVEAKIKDPELNLGAVMRHKGRAKERLAESLGVTVYALSKAAERARKRLREQGELAPEEKLKKFGMVLTDEFVERLAIARKGMIKVTQALASAERALAALRKAKLDLPSTRVERLQAMLDESLRYSKASTPVGLCPYCKGLPQLCNKCLSCNGSAMLLKNQEDGVLEELRDTDNPMVYHEGEVVPVGAFAESNGKGADVHLVEQQSEPVPADPWGLGDSE